MRTKWSVQLSIFSELGAQSPKTVVIIFISGGSIDSLFSQINEKSKEISEGAGVGLKNVVCTRISEVE